MGQIRVEKNAGGITGLCVIEPAVHGDARGYFMETYNERDMRVAVDLRADSETYGKWYGVTLSAENKKQFLIPEGFAHGFLVLSDEAEFCYKVSDFWHPNDEGGLAWNDPTIGIDWHVRGEYRGSASVYGCTLADGTPLNLSEKDQQWLGLKDTFKF